MTVTNEKELPEYLAWIIRNTYKESGLTGRDVDFNLFAVILNDGHFDIDNIPDTLLGSPVTVSYLRSDIEIGLGVGIEDLCNPKIKKFLKTFYEVQSWSDFWYGLLWKEECGYAK